MNGHLDRVHPKREQGAMYMKDLLNLHMHSKILAMDIVYQTCLD